MDADSLTFLLRGGHFDVDSRIRLGIWPHPPLRFDDLVHHLASLQSSKWFPNEPKSRAAGECVDEMGYIERVASDCFVYHIERSVPWDPTELAESTHIHFIHAEDVARYYLKWSLFLPGDLDGWKVI